LRDKDLTGVKLSLVENNIIKGSVILPYGVAPEGGIEVELLPTMVIQKYNECNNP